MRSVADLTLPGGELTECQSSGRLASSGSEKQGWRWQRSLGGDTWRRRRLLTRLQTRGFFLQSAKAALVLFMVHAAWSIADSSWSRAYTPEVPDVGYKSIREARVAMGKKPRGRTVEKKRPPDEALDALREVLERLRAEREGESKKVVDAVLVEEVEEAEEDGSDEGQEEAGDPVKDMRRVLSSMEESGTRPKNEHVTLALRIALEGGTKEDVLATLAAVKKSGAPADGAAYASIIRACQDDGPARIMALLHEAVPKGMMPQPAPYYAAIEALMRIKQEDRALSLYREMDRYGLLNVWEGSQAVNFGGLSKEVSAVGLVDAFERFANTFASRHKAGKGNLIIRTDPATKRTNHKQRYLAKLLKQRYGVKVRLGLPGTGQMEVPFKYIKEWWTANFAED